MRSWFNFNGIDTREKGILLDSEPQLQRGKERVTQVSIPGRAGALTLTEGEDVYDGYMQSVNIAVKGRENVRSLFAWLRGEGWVTFSNDPDKKQRVRIINALSLSRVSESLDWYKGTVQFYCEPLKEDIALRIQTFTDNTVIVNAGDVAEKPVIEVLGNGDITLTVNGEPFTLTGIEGGCIIDCDACEVLTLDGTQLITTKSSGEFPSFPVGRSAVSVQGAEAVNITRRQWYL